MPHDDPAQPMAACPSWCEHPPRHEWEDQWLHGPVRTHTWRRTIAAGHHLEIREIEQRTDSGLIRQREILLDVDSPTQWDLATAEKGLSILTQAVALLRDHAGAGTDGTVQ